MDKAQSLIFAYKIHKDAIAQAWTDCLSKPGLPTINYTEGVTQADKNYEEFKRRIEEKYG